MWMFVGCLSGRKAIQGGYTENLLSSTIMTVYSAGSVALDTSDTNKYTDTEVDGIGNHICGPLNPNDTEGQFIVAASVCGLSNVTVDTSYIPEAGWVSTTTTKRPRNTLAVSYKEDSTGTVDYSNTYAHFDNDPHDSVDAMLAYAAGGSSVFLRDHSEEFPTPTAQLEVKIPIASQVGDTAIWVICHVGELEPIIGWILDYTEQVLGTNPSSDTLTRQTQISVYSKVLVSGDLTGYETIRLVGTPTITPDKSLPPWAGLFSFDGFAGGSTFGTVLDSSVGGRFSSADE